MDRFLAFIVTVNNQVKDIPGFRFQCNKLLAAAGCAAVIVNQGQVPVRGQGAAAPAAKQFHQGRKFIFSKRKGKAAIAGTGIADGEVIAAHIALALRQEDFHPAAFGADHLHLGPVGELGDGGIVGPRAGTDI